MDVCVQCLHNNSRIQFAHNYISDDVLHLFTYLSFSHSVWPTQNINVSICIYIASHRLIFYQPSLTSTFMFQSF